MSKNSQIPSHYWLMDPGPYAPHVLAYERHIAVIGYSLRYVGQLAGTARHFCAWLHASDHGFDADSGMLVQKFAHHECCCAGYRMSGPLVRDTICRARSFVRFLVETGVIEAPPGSATADAPQITAYLDWLRRHRGLADSTLNLYRAILRKILPAIGMNPGQYDAAGIRAAILDQEGSTLQAAKKAQALRSWLQYNAVLGRCPASLVMAVPSIAGMSASYLPQGLKAEDVERLIASCDIIKPMGRRDRAILLLLARLGLRAGDVTSLTLRQIDWRHGLLRVRGKGRRETMLPLPQDAGDAILAWLEDGRPSVPDPHVFLCSAPPWRPFAHSSVVSCIVQRAIDRAGLTDTPSRGAHLLRHSAARGMLDAGASLQSIGALLRHQSIASTRIYTRVDIEGLRGIAQPWPGETSC